MDGWAVQKALIGFGAETTFHHEVGSTPIGKLKSFDRRYRIGRGADKQNPHFSIRCYPSIGTYTYSYTYSYSTSWPALRRKSYRAG